MLFKEALVSSRVYVSMQVYVCAFTDQMITLGIVSSSAVPLLRQSLSLA